MLNKPKNNNAEDKDVLAIETIDLTKKFGSFVAIDKIDIKVKQGAIHGLIGPNGSGKTTTIKCLAGLFIPTSGQVKILGKKVNSDKEHSNIGYIPEKATFPTRTSVYSYLKMIADYSKIKPRTAKIIINDLLDELKILKLSRNKATSLSSGQKKKVLLVQALLSDPKILILDEPAANLDPQSRIELLNYLKHLAKDKGKTIFITSHILTELQEVVESVTILDKGKIAHQDKYKLQTNEFGRIDCSDNEKLKKILTDKGYEVIDNFNGDETQLTKGILFRVDQEHTLSLASKLTIQADLELYSSGTVANELEDLYKNVIKSKNNEDWFKKS